MLKLEPLVLYLLFQWRSDRLKAFEFVHYIRHQICQTCRIEQTEPMMLGTIDSSIWFGSELFHLLLSLSFRIDSLNSGHGWLTRMEQMLLALDLSSRPGVEPLLLRVASLIH